jgi:prophage regulatory protein
MGQKQMRMLSMGELRTVKGISFSRVHLYRLIAGGDFVKPVALGKNRIGFVEAEVDKWLEEKIAQRDAKLAERDSTVAA